MTKAKARLAEKVGGRLAELGIPPYVMTPERAYGLMHLNCTLVVYDLRGNDGKQYMAVYFFDPKNRKLDWL